jgi:hypothetical protein
MVAYEVEPILEPIFMDTFRSFDKYTAALFNRPYPILRLAQKVALFTAPILRVLVEVWGSSKWAMIPAYNLYRS